MNKNYSIKKAAAINAASKCSTIIVNLLANAILARILTPEDYGVVAIITVFSTFFAVFSDMGISSGVVQNKSLTREDNIDIFSWTVYFGVILGVLFCVASRYIAVFYENDIYIPLGSILSLSLAFNTMNSVPNGILMKEKKFVYVGIRNIISALVNFIVTLVFASFGYKAYSIVLGSVAQSIILFMMNNKDIHLSFRFKPKWKSMSKIFGFSMFQFAYMFVNYFSRNLDNLLAGKLLGAEQLGYYDKAYKLMLYPINNFTQMITPVIHPILSDYADNKKYIYEKYIQLVDLLALVGGYVSIICFFSADNIIYLMYGSQWNKSVPCFQILSLTICVQMVSSSAGAIYQSLGNTKMMFYSGLTYMIETVFCIGISLCYNSIYALSIGVAIALFTKFFVEFFFLIKLSFGYKVTSFYKNLIPHFLIYSVVFVVLYANSHFVNGIGNKLVSFFEVLCVGTITYVLMLLITGKMRSLLKTIKRS